MLMKIFLCMQQEDPTSNDEDSEDEEEIVE